MDRKGTVHLSWVWRDTPDVASNHSIGYACSPDNGLSWYTSRHKKYDLPIRESTAGYAWRVPQERDLINQTSISVRR